MEGTNATISRAKEVAGEGCVMVKVGRPDQDMRWDVPAVGPGTMTRLIESGFSARKRKDVSCGKGKNPQNGG